VPTVDEEIIASFNLSDSIIEQGKSIQFSNTTAAEVSSIEWLFEGGSPSSSSSESALVSYAASGIYEVSMNIKNNSDQLGVVITKQITVLPTTDLIVHYPFDGNGNDVSGNDFTGTLFNGIANFTNRFGNEEGAFLFDGEFTYFETNTEIDDELGEAASFSAWIKINNLQDTSMIISNYNGTGEEGNCNKRVGFSLGLANQKPYFIFATGDDNYIGKISSTLPLVVNEWYHIVGTWNGNYSSEGFGLYIDGLKSAVEDFESGNSNCGAYIESEHPMTIGINKCSSGNCYPFDGGIDDVRVYGKVLSNDDIQALAKG
jgi:hypothetical protein